MTDRLDKIIAGCISGDSRSQEELYRMFSDRMYSLCLRYASDDDEASDFMQEGFIRVFSKIDDYRGEGSFEGWVRKIMVNTALQLLRKKRHLFIINEDLAEDVDFEIPEIHGELDRDDLIKMVQQLPVNQRMVFNLFAIEGYNHTEIAEMTGMPENTSKSHLHRARMTLKEMIKNSSDKKIQKQRKNACE